MDGEIWAKLRAAMPYFLDVDNAPDAYLRIWDEGTGEYVQFYRWFKAIDVTVLAPRDAAASERIVELLEAADARTGWMPKPVRKAIDLGGSRQWETRWARTSGVGARLPIVESVIEIMRDGLGMDEDRLCVRTWGEGLPEQDPQGLRSLRPTRNAAPARCTDWDDFTARLDWVLHTLPDDGVLILCHPNAGEWGGVVQFLRDGVKLRNEAASQDVVGIGQDEVYRRLTALGWREGERDWDGQEFPNWNHTLDARLDDRPHLPGLARAVAGVFRDVHGLGSPQELVFEAFRNGYSDDLAYLDAELGLAREAK
jgi:hypothetical protein